MHAIIFKTLIALFFITLFHGQSVSAAPTPHHSHHHKAKSTSTHHAKPASPSSQVEPISLQLDDTATSTSTSTSGTFIAKAPHWVVYSDSDINTGNVVPKASQLQGYNVFILAFYLTSGPADQAANWKNQLSKAERNAILKDLHSNGISLMVSVLGSEDWPTTKGVDATKFAKEVAQFVKEYGLDGVDVDYEDLKAMDSKTGSAENWLVTFTKALRAELPQGQYIITHAPVAPWFTTDTSNYPHGAYRHVHEKVGSDIDWYNLQYYNQGGLYENCDEIINKSGNGFPKTAIAEINKVTGVPFSKLVIGKPANSKDADSGYLSGGEFAACLKDAKKLGWNGGAMYWEYPHASVDLISTVRGLSFPLNLGL